MKFKKFVKQLKWENGVAFPKPNIFVLSDDFYKEVLQKETIELIGEMVVHNVETGVATKHNVIGGGKGWEDLPFPPAMPFENVWVERSDGEQLTSFRDNDNPGHLLQIWGIGLTKELSKDGETLQMCVLVSSSANNIERIWMEDLEDKLGSKLYATIFCLMNCLVKQKDLAEERVNIQWKGGRTKAGRQLNRVKKIVHVYSKKEVKQLKSDKSESKVTWYHSWEVQGHWRRCKNIGKNPEGEYCVAGFTWVVPHTKGDGELVKKLRVVHHTQQEGEG